MELICSGLGCDLDKSGIAAAFRGEVAALNLELLDGVDCGPQNRSHVIRPRIQEPVKCNRDGILPVAGDDRLIRAGVLAGLVYPQTVPLLSDGGRSKHGE